VRKELEACGIECYPQKEFDEDTEDKSDNDKIRVRSCMLFSFFISLDALICWSICFHIMFVLLQETMPFAVVGSDKEYQVNGKRVLGRKTPWGVVEGEWAVCLLCYFSF